MAQVSKAVLLAGGTGSRLGPLTAAVSKQLLPVFDQPLVYYPLSLLMHCGIREIAIVSTPQDLPAYRALLGDGKAWGVNLTFVEQASPAGLLDGMLCASDFIGADPFALALGDNVFCTEQWDDFVDLSANMLSGCRVLAMHHDDPTSFGTVEFNREGEVARIVEKPASSDAGWAVPGWYVYDAGATERARACVQQVGSDAGVTDLHQSYLHDGLLSVHRLGDDVAWFDAGRASSLLAASQALSEFARRTGQRTGAPDEVARRRGWISAERLTESAQRWAGSDYGDYLDSL